MKDYPFEVRPLTIEEGGGYFISYPDFDMCVSDGETIEEAIANEGHLVPEPTMVNAMWVSFWCVCQKHYTPCLLIALSVKACH